MIWSSVRLEHVIVDEYPFLIRFAWEALSWNLMIWFSVLLLFLILLLVHSSTRELVITRLTGMKERDEREQIIAGQAARSSFLVTFSFLILLLFVSVLSVDISKIPESEITAGKTKSLSIGLNFSLLDRSPKESSSESGRTVFETNGIPISKPAIVLLIMICQVGVFAWSARRQHLRDVDE
jgi:hypothetical protein